MDDKIYVRPAERLQVRYPRTGEVLPAEGAFVEPSTWWLRRLIDKDVVVADPPAEANAEAKNKAEAKPVKGKEK